MSVQGIPVGGLQTVEQSVATNTVTFHAGQNGLAIAMALLSTHADWASVVKEQRSRAVPPSRSGHVFGTLTHTVATHTDEATTAPESYVRDELGERNPVSVQTGGSTVNSASWRILARLPQSNAVAYTTFKDDQTKIIH